MDLPKNITQIGEVNPHCKIYVEDYAISFLKQLNRIASDKDMAVALFGNIKKEGDVSYIFVYGAGKLDFLQKEVRHLSQAQLQEMERLRRKYFQDYELVGYRLLNGEMIEGVHVYEQGICRYIAGYAQFYEKNDSMLAYMLDFRGGEAEPEIVNQEKYETVKKRQEERKIRNEEAGKKSASDTKKTDVSDGISDSERRELKAVWGKENESGQKSLKRMKYTAAAVFVLLCVAGVTMMNDTEEMQDFKKAAKGFVEDMTEQKLPDNVPVAGNVLQEIDTTGSTLVAEDKLVDAVLKENDKSVQETGEASISQDNGSDQSVAADVPVQNTDNAATDGQAETGALNESSNETSNEMQNETSSEASNTTEPQEEPVDEALQTSDVESGKGEAETEVSSNAVSYTIQKGDTLLDISINNYGSVAKIKEICSLNQIEDPDDIKVGQKILLP